MTDDTSRPVPLGQVALRLHPDDHVAIAKTDLGEGAILAVDDAHVAVRHAIPTGHKVALTPVAAGDSVRRYGQVIGLARRDIAPGDHVHVHNLGVEDFAREPDFGADARAVDLVPEGERRTFLGYPRPDGRAGTRNTIAVLSTVNCSAHAAGEIATPGGLPGL